MIEPRRVRLGWLGPALVGVGVAAAAVGVWFMISSRPVAGATIDTLRVDTERTLVVRAEQDGSRNFVELRQGDRVLWQSIVPAYAGRTGAPGIAWNDVAVSVRVIRGDLAEVFALSMRDGTKLGGFKLAPNLGKVVKQPKGPVTLTDHVRSYELVAGVGWHHLVAFELTSGKALWKHDLGETEISDGGISDGKLWILQGTRRRVFDPSTGVEEPPRTKRCVTVRA